MKKTKLLSLGAILFLATTACAQYTGPNTSHRSLTVKEVIKDASSLDKKDILVTMEGKVIEQINKDTFWFEDKTGKVLIEIEKKHFPSFQFDQNTLIRIVGEVDYDVLEEVEVEVENIELVR